VSIRKPALKWLAAKYGVSDGARCTSKFYCQEESWTKKSAWWIELASSHLTGNHEKDIHFICQKAPRGDVFYYLKIPVDFLLKNESKIDFLPKKSKFSLFLSAEPENLFQDERGIGRVSFKQFLVE